MTFSAMDFVSHAFLIRDAKKEDLDQIFKLSSLLNTFNLPADKNELEQVIEKSENSFALKEADPHKRAFLFVLVNQNNEVIGTSQVFAKHGTLDSPHLYFQVSEDERYSATLKKYFRHQTLQLRQSFDGPSEIGSLVLDPHYRSLPEKLGRNLSYVRFLFMAQNRDFFADQVIAELLPPLGPNLESVLWDAIGRKATGLDYREADMLSRKNKEFIKTLFPPGEIYTSLLPKEAADIIGQVGRKSSAAAHLLRKIGFRYSGSVDPFDGGPHYQAPTDEVSLIKAAMHGHVHDSKGMDGHKPGKALRVGLVGRFKAQEKPGHRFLSTLAAYVYNQERQEIFLHENTLKTLDLSSQERASLIDLTHKEV